MRLQPPIGWRSCRWGWLRWPAAAAAAVWWERCDFRCSSFDVVWGAPLLVSPGSVMGGCRLGGVVCMGCCQGCAGEPAAGAGQHRLMFFNRAASLDAMYTRLPPTAAAAAAGCSVMLQLWRRLADAAALEHGGAGQPGWWHQQYLHIRHVSWQQLYYSNTDMMSTVAALDAVCLFLTSAAAAAVYIAAVCSVLLQGGLRRASTIIHHHASTHLVCFRCCCCARSSAAGPSS
jgi:hypothetical protein